LECALIHWLLSMARAILQLRLTMHRANISVFFAAAIFVACPALADDKSIDFARDIQPIFSSKCVKCHGPAEQNGGLRLDTVDDALAGGDRGPTAPIDSSKSVLLNAVMRTGDVPPMPPDDENSVLNEREVATIRAWITQSASIPSDRRANTRTNRDRASAHWAFRPIIRSPVPTLDDSEKTSNTSSNEIDAFIRQRLDADGITPSPAADRVTLIRRVSLDLIGLPPKTEEVSAFVANERSDAYELLVDHLLDSPHFGERWARWWLDQARYADSDGYTNDEARVMWKYRDWVIDAFNRDLPFDQFVIQQLAGDLLPDAGLKELVATGFHRNTQTYSEGDSAAEEYRVENIVDRVHTTGVVLMGLTLGCARCHDHKFDPISQKEFYQLFAFFNDQDEPKIDVPASGWDSNDSAKGEKTTSLVMREREQPRVTHIHTRGDYLSPGSEVTPDVPSVLPPLPVTQHRPNRLDLAKWLISPEQPLTSRVIANRIWQVFFGKGLVETDDDFGTQGSRPTHPELLDWIASELQRQHWSFKSLVRQIVLSDTYRQGSNSRPDLNSVDPSNQLLARQSRLRLEAELVRDSTLEASGLLSDKIGGPSVFPPQPAAAMRMTQHLNREWKVSDGEDRYRRGLYTFIWRLAQHPVLATFNAPEGSTTCTRRTRANTPLQALMLLNDEAFVEAAQALALKTLTDSSGDDQTRITYMFRRCLSRSPESAESKVLLDLLANERGEEIGPETIAYYPASEKSARGIRANEFAAWTNVARALLNLDEFITRE
jgi:hypothetical protein